MNTIALLVSLLLCLGVVSGRSFDERREGDQLSEFENDRLNSHVSQMRHRRRRWQSNYGYDYPLPLSPYYLERRDYERNQQDLLPKITRLLEEISEYVRRPQPPPQPIYIPYPVPYPVPQFTACTPVANGVKLNISSRYPEMEDTNQNWGFAVEEENNQDEGDGSRPISFEPIKPIRPMQRPAPKVDRGTSQDSQRVTSTTTKPLIIEEASTEFPAGLIPHICNAAIISCCADENQKPCFNRFGCGLTYNNGKACSIESVNAALNTLRQAYSPASS